MKTSLLEILRCPRSGQGLGLEQVAYREERIYSGWLVSVSNPKEILPLSESQRLDWSLLNTFDLLSPEFDNPRTPKTVTHWLQSAGLEQIEVLRPKNVVGRGKMPIASRQ